MSTWNIDIITTMAALCLLVSFFIGKNAIWVTLIIGAVIAGGWGLNDLTSGIAFSWVTTKQILAYSILTGALWEIISRVSNNSAGKSA